MTNASANSTSSTETVVILGRTATGAALEKLCTQAGLRTVLLDSTDAPAASGLGPSSVAGCDVLVDAREDAHRRSAGDLAALEASLPASALTVFIVQHRPLGSMIKSLRRPEQIAGLVQPVDLAETDVAEVVRTRSTSDETVGRLVEILRRIGRKSFVVQDSPGFFSSRVSTSFLNEGMSLVGEGIAAARVEGAAHAAGMSLGPLETLDRVSLKLSDDLLHQELHDLEHEARGPAAVAALADEGSGHSGASAEAGNRSDAAHDHAHNHAHDHAHEHDQVHELDHGGHEHDHAHHHGHDHGHQHGHGHDHEHAHEAHDHGQAGHDGHEHDHDHSHDHAHEHAHAHDASPSQPGAASAAKPKKHVHKVKSKRMPEPAVYVMEKMAHGYRRMGREAGAGFYDYADDGSTSLWSGLKAFERRSANVPEDDIKDRMIFVQVAEALRCLQEGVVGSPADADMASIALCGFPSTAGGVVQFIEKMGPEKFSERAGELASRYGGRFQPPSNLAELIARHQGPQDGSFGPASAG